MCDFVFGSCLTLGLYDCWVSNLCLSVCPSEKSYVRHGVCLFVRLKKLCLAWGLSVCPSEKAMFGMGFVWLSICTSYVWHGVFSVCSKHS